MKTTAKSLAALALTASLALGASGAAQAGDVFWSIGMAQPGIHIGVSNMPPPVIVAPAVVYPRPVYVPPPRVVYLPPRPVYYGYQSYQGYGHGHDRHDRWDDRRGYDRRGDRDIGRGDRGDRGHRH